MSPLLAVLIAVVIVLAVGGAVWVHPLFLLLLIVILAAAISGRV